MCGSLDGVDGGSTTIHARDLLPTNVVARHYDLTIEPDNEKFTFDGSVTIDIDVVESSKSITLHTLDLKLHTVKISSNGQVITDSPRISHNAESQTSTFDFDSELPQGSKATLDITFTGEVNKIMAGFSRSFYKKPDGTESMIASTQMEPTDARRVIPCFDEPALKAEFTVTLIVDKHLTALSNMDVAKETEKGDKKVITFNKTPLMSTYLLAWVIGEFNYIEDTSGRVPSRVYLPIGYDLEHGRFALELAAKTLPFYEKLFGVDFPLPKMDQVAIPEFAAGAMENWGLITYRIVDLVIDEKSSAAHHKLRVAEVVQHELAHQWFGNLVTMDWWEGLWLNEGFATWVSWYSCNHFFPEWKVWEGYVTDTLQSALSLDSLRSSHPVEVPIKKSEEVNEIFDSISYAKGSCVLRMLSTYLGEDVFLEGVRHYVKRHAYKNTDTGDLWTALSEISGKPVSSIMQTWTKKMGYPVITVTESGNTMTVKQNRYLRTGDVKPEEDEVLFPVFLNVRSTDGIDGEVALQEREKTLPIPEDDFFKLNANQTGLYLTCYQDDRLEKLGKAAKAGLLSVEDRAGLIADAKALATSGYQHTSGFLNLLKNFDEESEQVVWGSLVHRIASVRSAWIHEDPAIKAGLDAFQKHLVVPRAHQIGWEFSSSDDQQMQQYKSLMFSAAGAVGDEKVVAAVKDLFARYYAGEKSALHPNIRGAVFSLALKYGGEKEYNQLREIYAKTTSEDEAGDAHKAFGRANQPELMKRTFDMIFTPEVKNSEIHSLLLGFRASREGIDALLDYLFNNWDTMIKELPPTLTTLPRVLTYLISAINEDGLTRVNEFFKDKDLTGFDKTLEQTLEAVRSRLAWVNRDREDVAAWVRENKYL